MELKVELVIDIGATNLFQFAHMEPAHSRQLVAAQFDGINTPKRGRLCCGNARENMACPNI